jgi:hypothetical protein
MRGNQPGPRAGSTLFEEAYFIMEESKPRDLITASEARSLLRVSRIKMATLLKNGTLRHYVNPLDNRVKLVSKAEVLSLIPERAEAA